MYIKWLILKFPCYIFKKNTNKNYCWVPPVLLVFIDYRLVNILLFAWIRRGIKFNNAITASEAFIYEKLIIHSHALMILTILYDLTVSLFYLNCMKGLWTLLVMVPKLFNQVIFCGHCCNRPWFNFVSVLFVYDPSIPQTMET